MNLSHASSLALVRALVRVFFRRVEVVGVDNLAAIRGGLVVAWHPNGLVDPALILAHSPRRVAFGARHGLFRVPVLGALMRSVGAIPIFRAADREGDEGDRRAGNRQSLAALAETIARGSLASLFPEGVSHDDPHLMELKTGAARLYYQARALAPATPPAIVPVGLHYDDKRAFRSHALIEFHAPLRLPPELDVSPDADEPDERARARVQALTKEIERGLAEAVRPTASWELHRLMHHARRLVRAERAHRARSDPGRPDMREKVLGFGRIWAGYQSRLASHPVEVAALQRRLEHYAATLRALALDDHEIDADPRLASPWLGSLLLLQLVTVYLVLPPILIVGYLVNLPVALLVGAAAKLGARAYKDEATVKLLVGAILFPLTWAIAGILAARGNLWLRAALPGVPSAPWIAGLSMAALAAIGGAVGVRYLEVARETARAVRIRLLRGRRRRELARLRRERRALFDDIMALAVGLELPGRVDADGRVQPA